MNSKHRQKLDERAEAQAVIAYIALGSNLGDRSAAVQRAVAALASLDGVEVLEVSELIETEPIGPPGQGRYLNGAARLRTTLTPRQLLDAMLSVERELGRDRSHGSLNGPRIIDLDLLLYGNCVIDEPGLSVPHPRMHERDFVLRPLRTIAADAMHPRLGLTVAELHDGLVEPTSEREAASGLSGARARN